MNWPKNVRRLTPQRFPIDLIHLMRSQRHRISVPVRKNNRLGTLGKCLLAESHSIAGRVKQSSANLASIFNLTKAALFQLRLHRSGKCLTPLSVRNR
jgi:hypothetical protein